MKRGTLLKVPILSAATNCQPPSHMHQSDSFLIAPSRGMEICRCPSLGSRPDFLNRTSRRESRSLDLKPRCCQDLNNHGCQSVIRSIPFTRRELLSARHCKGCQRSSRKPSTLLFMSPDCAVGRGRGRKQTVIIQKRSSVMKSGVR